MVDLSFTTWDHDECLMVRIADYVFAHRTTADYQQAAEALAPGPVFFSPTPSSRGKLLHFCFFRKL